MPNRMPIVAAVLMAAVQGLAGCATDDGDKPKTPTPDELRRVQIVDVVPERTSRFSNLSATVCRGNALEPLPSRDGALQLLKTRAYMNGYLLIHSVEVGRVQGSLAQSCPGGIQARGVGFTAAR